MDKSLLSFHTQQERPSIRTEEQVPLRAHIDLLHLFLVHHETIVEKLQGLLNAQKTPIQYQQDVSSLSRHIKDCFFTLPKVTRAQSRFGDLLEEAHWASGFKPRQTPGNDLVDPAEMMVRGFHFWRQTRWPGHKGRVRYAHTLFNLYLLRCLALLCMRLWDEGSDSVNEGLSQIQGVLDELWKVAPTDQPVLVRDVRWLFPIAMSPTTDKLSGYFEVAQQITSTFSEENLAETCRAAVVTGGGHLRAQLRHLAVQDNVTINDLSLVLITRKSNALDVALLTQGLVTLLQAYEHAVVAGDRQTRIELSDAIYQGISPDPELFLNRLDLLGPYSMIEHLFITTDQAGQTAYTDLGHRHRRLLQDYEALLSRLSKPLHDDYQQSRLRDAVYSPYGVLYGFSSNLLELMAFKTLQRDAVIHFSLEDIFTCGEADKLAWVSSWRNLPHIRPEVARQYEYPGEFVKDISVRIEQALCKRIADEQKNSAVPCSHIYLLSEDAPSIDAKLAQIPDIPSRYLLSSDSRLVAAHKAESVDQSHLLHCRLEGEYLLSYQTAGGWFAISKDMLTEVLGAGHDMKIAGLPLAAAGVLKLMCPDHVVLAGS